MSEMNDYEKIINDLVEEGVEVDEKILPEFSPDTAGLYIQRKGKPPAILLNPKKANKMILAEEIGHMRTGTARVIDTKDVFVRKRELKGRKWAYDNFLKLEDIAEAWLGKGNRLIWDTADVLGITEYQLAEALDHYQLKYGMGTQTEKYIIEFSPRFEAIQKPKKKTTEAPSKDIMNLPLAPGARAKQKPKLTVDQLQFTRGNDFIYEMSEDEQDELLFFMEDLYKKHGIKF